MVYDHNPDDSVSSATDARGVTIIYTYNLGGGLKSVTDPFAYDVAYTTRRDA